jgi:hypothetical protein
MASSLALTHSNTIQPFRVGQFQLTNGWTSGLFFQGPQKGRNVLGIRSWIDDHVNVFGHQHLRPDLHRILFARRLHCIYKPFTSVVRTQEFESIEARKCQFASLKGLIESPAGFRDEGLSGVWINQSHDDEIQTRLTAQLLGLELS